MVPREGWHHLGTGERAGVKVGKGIVDLVRSLVGTGSAVGVPMLPTKTRKCKRRYESETANELKANGQRGLAVSP